MGIPIDPVQIVTALAALVGVASTWHITNGLNAQRVRETREALNRTRRALADTKRHADELRRRNVILVRELTTQMQQTHLLFESEQWFACSLGEELDKPGKTLAAAARAHAAESIGGGLEFSGNHCWPSSIKARLSRLAATGLPGQPDDFFISNNLELPRSRRVDPAIDTLAGVPVIPASPAMTGVAA